MMRKALGPRWMQMLLGMVSLAVLGVAPAEAQTLEEVSVRLDWSWWSGQAPFIVAQEKGFYKDAGVTVDVRQGQGSIATVNAVGQGSETFGYVNQAVAAQAISKGVPIIAVATVWQKGPLGLVWLEGTKINQPKDLEGKRIGSTPTGSDAQALQAFIAATQLDPQKVQIINMPADAKFAALMAGKVDVLSGDTFYYSYPAEAQGKKTGQLRYADHGVNLPAFGLVVNTKVLAEKPQMVRGFVAATIKGFQYTFKNPDEAIDIFLKKTGDVAPRPQHLANLVNYQKHLHTANTEGKPLGWQSPKDWEEMLTILEKYAGMTDRKSLDSYFTNAFLPAQ